MARAKYSDVDRARFLVALADAGGDVGEAAKARGVPRRTASDWAKRAAVAKLAEQDGRSGVSGGTPTDTTWHDVFIAELAETGNATAAASKAGVSRSSAYAHRDIDPAFKALWEEAEAIADDALVAEARRRAVTGVEEPVFYQGEICGTIKRYSDTMLTILLKHAHGGKYRESQRHEHSGPGGGPIPYKVYEGFDPRDV